MATFQEKLDHACRTFSVTVEDVCAAVKIKPFSLLLHATGQRHLDHNEMVLLCQYFDVPGDYFVNTKIRFIDEETLPTNVCELLKNIGNGKKTISCYEVESEDSPDLTPKQLLELLETIGKPFR